MADVDCARFIVAGEVSDVNGMCASVCKGKMESVCRIPYRASFVMRTGRVDNMRHTPAHVYVHVHGWAGDEHAVGENV